MTAPRLTASKIGNALDSWIVRCGKPGSMEIRKEGSVHIFAAVDKTADPAPRSNAKAPKAWPAE